MCCSYMAFPGCVLLRADVGCLGAQVARSLASRRFPAAAASCVTGNEVADCDCCVQGAAAGSSKSARKDGGSESPGGATQAPAAPPDGD